MENLEHNKKELKSKINSLNISQKENLSNWAIEVKKIQDNKNLSKKEKIYDLKKLNNKQAFKDVLIYIINFSKSYWKKASWSQKIGAFGLTGGLVVAGSTGGAGIAALGGAIGLPLFLVTTAGGTLVGTIIDSLNKKN